MTSRHVYESGAWKNYTLTYDAENRLATVSGPVTANFKYDGDTGFAGASSKRVRATINGGLDTVFIGNYFEWNVATQTKRTYRCNGKSRGEWIEGRESISQVFFPFSELLFPLRDGECLI